MKKLQVVLVVGLLVGLFSAPAGAVQFRSDVDHWDTEQEALAVPAEVRLYYTPYFNLHDPKDEKLKKGEELFQLDEDYLVHERVPERLGGTQFVWWKKGGLGVRVIATKVVVRDPRCSNSVDWAKPVPAAPVAAAAPVAPATTTVKDVVPPPTKETSVVVNNYYTVATTPAPKTSVWGDWWRATLHEVLTEPPHPNYYGGYAVVTTTGSYHRTGSYNRTGGWGGRQDHHRDDNRRDDQPSGQSPSGYTGGGTPGGGGTSPGGSTGNGSAGGPSGPNSF